MRSTMLKLSNINTYYGPSHVLQDVSLEVKPGEIVCLLGANAAGKTTTMKTIFGLVRPRSGSVLFDEQPIEQKLTGEIVSSGLALETISPVNFCSMGCSSKSTEPERGRTRPKMVFIVVVLPAALAPSRQTISPGLTSRETSC